MSYKKTVWKDRVTEKPNTYKVEENTDGTITLYPTPGQVIEKGTPINAYNLNKIEDAIVELFTDLLDKIGKSDNISAGQIIGEINENQISDSLKAMIMGIAPISPILKEKKYN